MRIKKSILIIAATLFTLFVVGSVASQGLTPVLQAGTPQIHLKAGSFTPALGSVDISI